MKRLFVITAFVLFAGLAFGQTLKKGAVIGIYEANLTPNPDVTMNQVLDFLTNKFYPEINKYLEGEGVTFFLMQGDRGEPTGKIAWGIYCESEEVRNEYWPEEGTPSDKGNALNQKMQPLGEELLKMATYRNVGGDWKVL